MMRIRGSGFNDADGRTLLLRGVNLGGSSKVPKRPDGATHLAENFFEHRTVSFVGRPFPLDEADEHFTRLREWGLTFVRFLVTWEAIEHAGPGEYDYEYLDYVSAVIKKAGEHGIQLFVDPHQDVWSRFTGGDGAPGWTLEAVGFDMTKFKETGAAITHQTHGDPYPWLIWPTNAEKLAAATMFTLFFAGNDFAPQTRMEGDPVQDYLQRHYIAAIQQLARRLRNMPHVVGYDTMNEPQRGWIGLEDLTQSKVLLGNGQMPTAWQAILLGAGFSQEVAVWEADPRPRFAGRQSLNVGKVRAWREGCDCVWRRNGIWDVDGNGTAQLLRPDHFARVNGQQVQFSQDYYRPFANRFARAIREVHPEAFIFVESIPGKDFLEWHPQDADGIVYAPHWYDVATLVLKEFKPLLGFDNWTGKAVWFPWAVRRSFANQLQFYKQHACDHLGGPPVHLGEIGIHFDIDRGRAFRTGDFSVQEKALDRSLRAVEDSMMNATVWNYTPDNDNTRGDQWNGEDFSVFSRDQQKDPTDIHSGGRALRALLRPYPKATAGEPMQLSFDMNRRVFRYKFRHNPSVKSPTEIFVPRFQYPEGYSVQVSDGKWESDPARQLLRYWHTLDQDLHSVRISPR
jgi:hypothetical protein